MISINFRDFGTLDIRCASEVCKQLKDAFVLYEYAQEITYKLSLPVESGLWQAPCASAADVDLNFEINLKCRGICILNRRLS